MYSLVFSALLPVVALIAAGFAVGRLGWVGQDGAKRLSNLAFMVLTPVLLFRTMGKVHVEQLDLKPATAYILALAIVFAGTLAVRGMNRTAAVLALAATYSNAVMIGIPLVGLAWGDAGLVTLFTLIPVHSLLLLTTATVVLEFVMAHEETAGSPHVLGRLLRVGGRALYKALLHPVPLPIIAGLLFAQTGWVIPDWLDRPLRWVGSAFGPVALVLVGITLARAAIGAQLRGALVLTAVKNFLMPLLAALLAMAMGMSGLPLLVTVVAAALPIGANVFMFSQRYGVAQQLVTAAVAISTVLALVSVSLVILLLGTP